MCVCVEHYFPIKKYSSLCLWSTSSSLCLQVLFLCSAYFVGRFWRASLSRLLYIHMVLLLPLLLLLASPSSSSSHPPTHLSISALSRCSWIIMIMVNVGKFFLLREKLFYIHSLLFLRCGKDDVKETCMCITQSSCHGVLYPLRSTYEHYYFYRS